MRTLIESIEEKYDGEDGSNYGFIVFMSSSPECKKGMFPPVMTLCDYDIETVGKCFSNFYLLTRKFIAMKY